jgi:Fanconi anemia group M protein
MIVVDDREVRSGICEALAAQRVPHQIAHLAVADYVINDSIFVERKTLADFLESIQDLRLFDQVARLRADKRRALLLVEGSRLPGSPSVRGILCTLAAQWCLPVLRSVDVAGTAWLLAHMQRNPAPRMAPYHRYDYRPKPHISSLGERMLLQAQNVGPDIARRLLQRFGSLHAVLNAGKEELMSVQGVGAFIAGQILLLRSQGEK